MKISDLTGCRIIENAALENILTRVSVRRFTDAKVSCDEVASILRAAMSAPSGVNKQPWEFIIVDDHDILKELSDALPYAKMAAYAPLAIVVCGNTARFLPEIDGNLWEQDCSAASENILLAAHAIGLGGVWTCLYPHDDRMEAVRRILNIGPDIVPFNLIPIGHPDADRVPLDKWNPERIHFNSYK